MAGSTVVVSVLADVKKFTAGLDSADGALSKLGKGLGAAAATAGVAMAAATAAAVALGTKVVQSFAEFEQNLGGAQAVFGAHADELVRISESAYKNMGVSQSDYLANINKMGALFQGSGLDQQRSLDLSTQAMQRAADMASVMGIDMSTAMESVTGAAKGNFTMMDNLGVAMNATSIEAYAASKGMTDWSFSTATAAEKSELAMQMFLENTSQYAGNFAREATETVSGSIGLLKGAVGDLIAGLGVAGSDMGRLSAQVVEAFQAVTANIAPVLENMAANLPQAIGQLVTEISTILPALIGVVAQIAVQILSAAPSIIEALAEGLISALPILGTQAATIIVVLVESIMSILPMLITAGIALVNNLMIGLAQALPTLLPAIVTGLLNIVTAIIAMLPQFITAAIQLAQGLLTGLVQAIPQIVTGIVAAIPQIITAIVSALPALITGAIELFLGMVEGLITALPEIIAAVVAAIPVIIETLVAAIPQMIQGAISLFLGIMMGLLEAIPQIITSLIGAIPQIITTLVGALPQMITGAIELFLGIVTGLIKAIPQIIEAVIGMIPQIITALIGAVPQLIQAGIDLVAGLVSGLWEAAASVGEALLDIIGGAIDGFLSFLGINSPSKLFKGFGVNVVEGLAAGLADTGIVDKAMTDLQTTVAGTSFELQAPTIATPERRIEPANTWYEETSRQPRVVFPDRITLRIGDRDFEGYIEGLADGRISTAIEPFSAGNIWSTLGVR